MEAGGSHNITLVEIWIRFRSLLQATDNMTEPDSFARVE